MVFDENINECRAIISSKINISRQDFSPSEQLMLKTIVVETNLLTDIGSIVMEYSLEIIRPHQVYLVYDFDAIRNIFLLSAMTGDRELFESVRPDKHHIIYIYGVPHTEPDMTFFTKFSQMLPRSNDFMQILHNVLCYYGRASWLDKFMLDESSAITGTYYMAVGSGSIYDIELNMKKWGSRIDTEKMIKFVKENNGRNDVISLLSTKFK